jgi:hypothetical protein
VKMGQIYSWFLLFIKYKTFIFQLSAPVKKGAIEDSDFVVITLTSGDKVFVTYKGSGKASTVAASSSPISRL